VSRFAAFLTIIVAGVAAPATIVLAQNHGHGGGGFSGHGGGFAGRGGSGFEGRPGDHGLGAPAPGGRYAGPYGYAYRGGAFPAGAYGSAGYPPGYAGPPARRPNSLGADWRLQQEEARAGVRQGHFAPLGHVIESLERREPGRQLDAGIEYDGGRAVYRVRWITVHGRRIDFMVDAVTGAVIGER
jgi:hypothetical protein